MPKSTKDSEVKKAKSTKKKADEVVEIKESKKEKVTKNTKKTKATKKATKTTKTKAEPKEKATKTKKNTVTKKASTSKTKKSKSESISVLEYYDLPYRYNQTLVKILVQTPETLFVYWDISDNDRKNLEETYGNDFFYNTKPVLIIHNETMNYSFEVDINDFANSWYLRISDTDCKYNIELGRRFINNNYNNEYIYISSSNELITPNDHVLYNFDNPVQFKNVKTNTYFSKDINNIPLIKKLFKELYPDEILYGNKFNNPSSMFF